MRFTFVSILPKAEGKLEILFSNGVNEETAEVTTLDRDTWCLYNESGKPIKFYSSIEELIIDFEDKLNKDE